jgi:hypothetical protein
MLGLFAAVVALGLDPVPVDQAALAKVLDDATRLGTGAGVVVGLPMPDGGWAAFEVWDAPVMAPELAGRYPSIRTYLGRAADGGPELARFSLTPLGLHGLARTPRGDVALWSVPGSKDMVVSRWGSDPGEWECLTGADPEPPAAEPYQARGPVPVRTYRFAVACTGEFAAHASLLQGRAPNVPDALAAVVVMVNALNLATETDVGVHLELVANNDVLMFLDPQTDPYPATDSGACLSANISTLNAVIGQANYDAGHVLTRIPGGVAYLRAYCGSNKGGGVSGAPRTDTGNPLEPQILMHEVGHQLGANHTLNGNVDRCLNGRNGSTAWEPGSGSTILSYAGGCPVGNVPPGDNLQVSRDLIYHEGNIGEVRAFLAAGGANCGTSAASGNEPPVIVSMPPASGLTIPRLTPFELVAAVTDPQGDALTYSWEQQDLGPQQALTEPDNGTSPLFRVFAPATSPGRLFPRLADILAGNSPPAEELPSVSPATRRFRLAARDNHPGAGGVTITPNISLAIAPTGPFEVTGPAAGAVLLPGAYEVTWSVAGTDQPPVGTATVTILLSTDGGQTFPLVLASGVPNTGSAWVQVPAVSAPAARVRINADGNVYCAFSRGFSMRACNPDANGDGNADQDDVAYLVGVIAGGPNPAGFNPDFNADGNADQDDATLLIHVIAGGGCGG